MNVDKVKVACDEGKAHSAKAARARVKAAQARADEAQTRADEAKVEADRADEARYRAWAKTDEAITKASYFTVEDLRALLDLLPGDAQVLIESKRAWEGAPTTTTMLANTTPDGTMTHLKDGGGDMTVNTVVLFGR